MPLRRPARMTLLLGLGSLLAAAYAWVGWLRPVAPPTGPRPAVLEDGWPCGRPTEEGFDEPALDRVLQDLLAGPFLIHGVLVERHGRLVMECYQGGRDQTVAHPMARRRSFGPTVRHDLRSIGKSVTSLLLGIAQGEGLVGPVSTPVMDAYPELSRVVTPDKRTITLEHLLTMTSGLAWREGEGLLTDEDRLAWRKDVPRFVLSRPGAEPPGTRFHYCGGNTALLADLLVRASGMPFREYARVKLFEPLGIRDWEWVGDLHGRPLAFAGLRMRPRDLLKVGRLVLNNGAWGGRQVVPKAWIRTSLEPRFRTGVSDFSYGYQWWTGTVAWHGKALPWKAAFGNGGQRLFLVPDLDLAVVTTAGAYDQMPTARRVNAFLAEVVATVRP